MSANHLTLQDILLPGTPQSVRAHYEALTPTASACLGCGACESRCPFGVKIAQRMRKAADLFGR